MFFLRDNNQIAKKTKSHFFVRKIRSTFLGTKDVVNWYNFTETHKSCILRDTSGCLIYFNISKYKVDY